MKRYQIEAVRRAANKRKPGYLEAIMAVSEVHGDWIVMSEKDAMRIRREFRLSESRPVSDVKIEFFPSRPSPCVHRRETGETVVKKCCGGKEKVVMLYKCANPSHSTTALGCLTCRDYVPSKESAMPVS